MKAEPMTTSQLDRWLQGKIPRRHLAIPFGGPNSGSAIGKADNGVGYDLDGEWFDESTDLYGPLRTMGRERLVDWHHVTFADRTDPVNGLMKGAILGRIVLDDEPSNEDIDDQGFYGIWADFWANAGEKRRQLVAALERRAVPLFGSSQPLQSAVRIAKSGHIDVWPVRFHTITTTPQNTHAVLPALKAGLDDPYLAELSVGALRAFLAGEDNLGRDLLPTSAQGEGGAKAGRVLSGVNERDLDEAVTALEQALERARTVLTRAREGTTQSNVD
jgi:hypothetical protein